MGLTKLLIAGVGPFKNTTLDFSDGNGKPHMGPHIIAGVNGCGKSTVLRAIAASLMGRGHDWLATGFPREWWAHRLEGWENSLVATTWHQRVAESESTFVSASTHLENWQYIPDWARYVVPTMSLGSAQPRLRHSFGEKLFSTWRVGGPLAERELVVSYAPSLSLRHYTSQELGRAGVGRQDGSLAFEGALDGTAVQTFMQNLRLSASHAQVTSTVSEVYTATLRQVELALTEMIGKAVAIEVEPGFEPILRVRLGQQRLNLSQLPDGARNLLGWFLDFVRRRGTATWELEFAIERPSVLLIDEIDAHLHPRWQRVILPAAKKALGENVQIIATTHSPFVISSCPGARVHVLDVDEEGHSKAREPVDAPVGQSVAATIKDVFGVDSRFDVETERELKRWNELRRAKAVGELDEATSCELAGLTTRLTEKSEELRLIVGTLPRLPKDVLQDLLLG